MKKLFLATIFYGIRLTALSQTIFSEKYENFENMAAEVQDSLDHLKPQLQNLNFDSLYRATLVKQTKLFIGDLGKDYLSYPFRIWKDWMNKGYPSRTEREILLQKYKIHFDNINTGYNEDVRSLYFIYDSLMFNKIEAKYGAGILKKVRAEAKKLDQTGQGLILPRVKSNINTSAILAKNLKYIHDDTVKCDRASSVVALINEQGKITNVAFFSYGWHSITFNMCEELENFKERIKNDLNKLNWQPATFKNKPQKCSIAFDRYRFEIWFM